MSKVKSVLFIVALIALLSGEAFPGKIKPARIFGRVVLNNYSRDAGIAPVVFDHWLHRAQFTCRLCHIDIGFAMNAGTTRISAQTNMQGFYCGACHDGNRVHAGTTIFAACSDDPAQSAKPRCGRCHSRRKKGTRKYTFDTFTKGLPRHSMGDAIDWEKAEEKGQIKPVDFLDGISFERKALKTQNDFAIGSRADWMTDVIFSHKKHATWNGCEVCHPEIFPSTKKGTVKYNMFQVFNGQYCGVCHGKVAFSLFLCHKCHVNPVQ